LPTACAPYEGPGESYNDIILRLAGGEPRHSQNPVV
jgi:hypothetical protein